MSRAMENARAGDAGVSGARQARPAHRGLARRRHPETDPGRRPTMTRRRSWRAIKRHRSYTYEEAARALRAHKNTVANWAKSGALVALTNGKPHIILGRDLIDFLKERKARNRIKLGPGEFYCLGCKTARRPAEGLVEALPGDTGPVNLRAICPVCEGLMHRRVARDRIDEMCAGLGPTD